MGFPETRNITIKALSILLIFAFLIPVTAGCGGNSNGKSASDNNYGQLLVNGNFLNDMDGWTVIDQPQPPGAGTNLSKVIPVNQNTNGIHMTRVCNLDLSNLNESGSSGVGQKIKKKLTKDNILTVRALVRVDSESGSAIAGSNANFPPESAVQLKLVYTDSKGRHKEWYHGFYFSDIVAADKNHFTQVKQGAWTRYLSGDLMSVIGAGSTINEFQVYGIGWSFDGYAADISVTLSK